MSDRSAGMAPSRVTAILGPTNTGKTHLAVERMLGHASGMIGLPLRLLAREIYERIVKRRGVASVALITGEEKIVPPRPAYFVCTVEAMPLERSVDFLAVDEIQLVADPERGHVFTQRLLHARGRFETMFLGAGTMAPLMRALVPDAEIVTRDRLSTLSYAGSKKLTRLPRRSAVVAFSTEQVYAIAELLRRQRGGAAVVMGSLSPRTRNAQVELFQSGEVDFLVATDAIGMGLNMDVDHVAFAGLRKFDGRRTRWLHAAEIGQIAGRAGRHLRDGTFGVTGEAEELDEDLVEQVVEHRFDPVEAAEWRSGRLDFDTLPDLLRSLTVTPDRHGLRLTAQALDETLLRRFAADEDVKKIARSRGALMRLWEACQLPDFQKTTLDEHARLSKEIFTALTSHGPHGRGGRLTEDWVAPRFNDLDRDDGQIDQLSARLSGVRTLSYIANRPDWMAGAQEWRDRTKALEERLSDVLHERLTARFVDRRTAALMRALNVRSDVLAGVADDGEVTVEGEVVGHLDGVCFTVDAGGSALADRALRQAATRAVGPEVARRLGRLAADEDATFSVMPDGGVLWNGALTGRIINEDPFSPRVRLLGELGPVPARERAERRMEAWLAAEAGRALKPLKRLRHAIESGALTGLPRGLAFRLVEAGGLIPRREVERDLAALSQHERRTLKTFAIRVGAHSVWLPGVMKPRGAALAQAFLPREATNGLAGDGLLNLPEPPPSARALSAFGRRAVDRWTAPVEALEALAEAQRAAGKAPLSDEALNALGWTGDQARAIHAALRTPRADRAPRPGKPTPPTKDSPFAALAQLTQPPPPAAKPKTARRPHRRPRRATDGKAAE
ncbi:helicase-related protein [Brevundimonas diminuta]|jgi:ATP-dependent RNA helicase SUPV3L1/SUV3|uniref:helicase-related protein n=1 Tax=Brevundimonas diminuta TaxID=293 RepID=UPI0035DE6308